MIHNTENITGSEAYRIAMDNLKSTWNKPAVLKNEFKDRYFFYGEEGRGLVMPGGLAYISSTYNEEIRKAVGEIEINTEFYVVRGEFKDINGILPDTEVIPELIAFTEMVKERCEAGRRGK